jgi:hypothetical protein
MLQIYVSIDVAKVDQNVSYDVMVVYVCYKFMFPMFNLLLSYVCCKFVLLDVVYVSHICCKCFV